MTLFCGMEFVFGYSEKFDEPLTEIGSCAVFFCIQPRLIYNFFLNNCIVIYGIAMSAHILYQHSPLKSSKSYTIFTPQSFIPLCIDSLYMILFL